MANISDIKELAKTKQGRKVLGNVMREAGIKPKKDKAEPEVDDVMQKAYDKARRAAESEGKGFFGQRNAGKKAEKKAQEEYQIATMGTKASRSRIFEAFGLKVGKEFRKKYDKLASEEEIKKAKESLGLDKKEKEPKPKGGGGSSKSTINANQLMKEIIGIRNIVQSLAKFTLVNRGFTSEIDPKTGKILYRNKQGQFAKSKEATFANFNNKQDKQNKNTTQSAATDALTKKINADEDPQIKIVETLEAILKSLGEYDRKSVQEKLNSIQAGGGESDGLGIPSRATAKGLKLVSKAAGKVTQTAGKLGKGAANLASRAAGALGYGKTAEKLATGGAKVAEAGDVAGKVIKLLGEKSGKILGKSIAGAGILFGGWDMVKHAAKGDWVGMGLDATAIAGSTAQLTGVGAAVGAPAAIAASLASVIRDGYEDIFGLPPEKDPRFKDNMNMAMEIGSGWVKNKLGMEAKKEDKKSEKGPAPGAAQPAQSSAAAAATAGTSQTAPPPAAAGKAPAAAPATEASGPKFSGGGGQFGGGGASGSWGGAAPKPETPAAPSGGKAAAPPTGGVAGAIAAAMSEAGITNKYAQVALLANIKKESNFQPKSENLSYGGTSNDRIRKIFTKRAAKYSDAELDVIKKDPYKMGELMYGKDTKIGQSMGNTEEGDGFKYRGRGFIQLTGKNNYAFYGKKVGADLVSNPDLANDPTVAAKIASAYVMTALKGKQDFADQKSANMAVTKAIGGNLDLSKGYGAEILAKVDKYSQELGGGAVDVAAPAGGGGGGGGPQLAAAPSGGGGAAPGGGGGMGGEAAPGGGEAAPAAAGQGPGLMNASAQTGGAGGPMDILNAIKADTTQILQNLQPQQNGLGGQMSEQSNQLAAAQMTAAATAPASDNSVNVSGGGSKAQPPPQQNKLPIAGTRTSESSFMRALAKDFAHPSAFTTVSMV
jgi:predicted chitinase